MARLLRAAGDPSHRARRPFEAGARARGGARFGWGLVLGFPALQVKHHYLAMVTLGFNIIVFLVLRNWESLTGGSFGISSVARPAWGAFQLQVRPRLLLFTSSRGRRSWSPPPYWILHSRWGRAFPRHPGENEMRAEGRGQPA